MGIRLYPTTKDVGLLERLAGVPAGTKARLDQLNDTFPTLEGLSMWERDEQLQKQYKLVRADAELAKLDNFIIFGWGKFNHGNIATDYSGALKDKNLIQQLLELNNIQIGLDLLLLDGVHWS